jgi:hypothetical protein
MLCCSISSYQITVSPRLPGGTQLKAMDDPTTVGLASLLHFAVLLKTATDCDEAVGLKTVAAVNAGTWGHRDTECSASLRSPLESRHVRCSTSRTLIDADVIRIRRLIGGRFTAVLVVSAANDARKDVR